MDYEAVLADYARRMTPTEADAFLSRRNGTVSAAIKRGEIDPYVFPDAPTRAFVTPAMLAEWLVTHCRGKGDAATGSDCRGVCSTNLQKSAPAGSSCEGKAVRNGGFQGDQ